MTQTPNMLDFALLALLAWFLVRALVRGLVREIMGLIGVVAALVASAMFYRPVADFLRRVIGDPAPWWDAVAFAAVLVAVFTLCLWVGSGLSRLIHAGPFSWLDRLLGALVGLAKGVLVSYLLLNVLLMAMPLAMLSNPGGQSGNLVSRSWLAPHVIRAGRYLMDLVPQDLTRELQEKAGLIKGKLDSGLPSLPPLPPLPSLPGQPGADPASPSPAPPAPPAPGR
jgi:membrane protein required for colicin V production